MSQSITYNNLNDGVTSRRYTGFPLNSTLVSSYTPDTIRSIITHAAAGQPYSTAVWIRINRVGIQVSAQDPQIARTRVPVFIPIGLIHDIFMLPSINNVICIVYDELQSNMKGVLLYVVHPSDAQLLRDDFRIVKQANNTQQQTPYTKPNDIYSIENNQIYNSISPRKSPLSNDFNRNNVTIRQPSPRRIVYVRENETNLNRELTSTLPPINNTPSKGSYHSEREDNSHRRHRSPRKNRTTGYSPSKRSSDSGIKQRKSDRSRSPEKQDKPKLPISRSTNELTQQQQQQMLIQQQQQMAAWQSTQQMPLIPMGIYNRYVPKTIPLPTGETLKTSLPPPGVNGTTTNGTAMAYIEPYQPANVRNTSRSLSRSPSNSPQQQNRSLSAQNPAPLTTQSTHHHHHHRRHHTNDNTYVSPKLEPNLYNNVSQSSRSRSKYPLSTNDNDDETKQYLKMLVDEMQLMKIEMNKLRQTSAGTPKGRSDSLQIDLKEIRSHIDHLRARMAMTPKIPEK